MHLNLFVTKCRDLKNVDGSDDVFAEVQFRGVTERTETVEDGGACAGALAHAHPPLVVVVAVPGTGWVCHVPLLAWRGVGARGAQALTSPTPRRSAPRALPSSLLSRVRRRVPRVRGWYLGRVLR